MKTIKIDVTTFTWRTFLIWQGVALLFAVITRFVPLLRTFGFEYAMFSAALCALGAGHLAALYPQRIRAQLAPFPGAQKPIAVMFTRSLTLGLTLAVPILLVALITILIVPPCNIAKGFEFFGLLVLPAIFFGSALGLAVGLQLPGKLAPSIGFVLFYLGTLAYAFFEFWSTPAVFVFGPAFGYFPGVLYDENLAVDNRLFVYRGYTVLQALTILSLLSAFLDKTDLRLRPSKALSNSKRLAGALLLIGLTVAIYLAQPSLRIRTRSSDLQELLSRKVSGEYLDLYFPPGTSDKQVSELTFDAQFSLGEVMEFFEETPEDRIAVYFFRNSKHKAAAMGASRTNVAKPWRREVYVLLAAPPHRVLRHELVHALSSDFARGPFKVAGSLGGLIPNPGLIEGIAVAGGGPRKELTLHQRVAGMKELELLGELDKIFGLGFWGLHASAAYDAAGSFCLWLKDTSGVEALKKLYLGQSFEEVLDAPLEELERRWHAFLDKTKLTDREMTAIRHRFDRPAVIHKKCVHEVARLRQEAMQASSSGEWSKAIALEQEAMERSGTNLRAQAHLVHTYVEAGRTVDALELARELLKNSELTAMTRLNLEELVLDLTMGKKSSAPLAESFKKLSKKTPGIADRRRLFVKSHLATLDRRYATPIIAVLARHPVKPTPKPALVALRVAEAAAAIPEDPVLLYLLARQYFINEDREKAKSYLQKSIISGLAELSRDLYLEALLMEARGGFIDERYKDCERNFARVSQTVRFSEGAREKALDWSKRCGFAQSTPPLKL